MTSESNSLVVFFAWQSEVLKSANRRGIEASLRAAATDVERKYVGRDLTIHIDKDTANRAGTPAIADTILEKIAACDVFVGDVTITNAEYAPDKRLSPNANVLLELGYAAGVQGWDRAISVFNRACGHLPDALPFDLRHRRISAYELTDDAARATRKSPDANLTSLFVAALTEIIEKNPARPADLRGLSAENIKQRRDIENLNWLLRRVHWPTLEAYIEQGPKLRSHMVVDFFDEFEAVLRSTYFHLYDPVLRNKVDTLHAVWARAMSHSERYEPQPYTNRYVFTTPINRALTTREERHWNAISAALRRLRPAMDALLDEIRARFPTIDIKALSEAAWERHLNQHRTFEESLKS
jgi:hypothetical protein